MVAADAKNDSLNFSNFRLCYVDGAFAWFTSHFEEEWGDDWNDAPYEHNAGRPYGYHYSKLREYVAHSIVKVAFDGPFDQPNSQHVNSPYSVEAINNGLVPWLVVWPVKSGAFIRAGATL